MAQAVIKIGPADHGRHMTLEEFDHAEILEGFLYELGRGRVVVSDVPKLRHLVQVMEIRQQLAAHHLAHPGRIYVIAAGSECKILVPGLESERHPDLTIYRSPPDDDEDLWSRWIPDLVIEVVSPGSEHRDYVEKPEEYLVVGVREYWIVDADKEQVMLLRRVGERWRKRVVQPPDGCKTRLLPGFTLDCGAVFQAARAAGR
jgi:Uma2 family endonuclease